MEFRVLGPVGVWRDGRLFSVVGPKQRTLLAVLVLNASRVVSHDRLLTALWGNTVPASGRRLLHNHLWSLRRLLTDPAVLASTPMGYSLQIPSDASDLGVFLTETEAARACLSAGDAVQASERFQKALALWRGSAFEGASPGFQSAEGPALEEQRTAALVGRIEADLASGGGSELVSELRGLVAENPLHERLRAQLMLALHRAGRTAEALEEYRRAHEHFRRELGLEPGENLARLHQEILSADPGLDLTAEVRHAEAPAPPARPHSIPRQLPADIARFTGREESLRQLDRLLAMEQEGVPVVVITAIAGTAGVGKTALATHWGHRVADRFPDGQLYVNLHGYSQQEPVTGAQALRQLLGGLGLAVEEIPRDTGERETLYRSLMAGKRMLVVLDDAARSEQIRPLLPGSPSCKVVITSRDSLRGLSVTHDVRAIALEVLSAEEARALLVAVLGIDRIRDEMDAVSELARLCGYLPLALRLAAAHLASEPALPVGDFAARLRKENPLATLEIEEDPHIGVRAAFELSYRALPEPARLVFRLMGLAPGEDISLDGVAALTDLSVGECRAVVDTLVNAHLVGRDDARRLTMHDLIRVYARDRAEVDDPEADRRAALTRLFDWYLRTTVAAMDLIDPGRLTKALDIPVEDDDRARFKGPADTWKWMKAEHRSLMAVVSYGASHGWSAHAWRAARSLSRFFDVQNRIDDWIAIQQIGLTASRVIGDQHGEAQMLAALGYAYMFAGDYSMYLDLQRQSLALCEAMGDREGQARALSDIGYGLTRVGRLTEAVEVCRKSIELERSLGKQPDPAGALHRISITYLQLGRPEDALSHLQDCRFYLQEQGGGQGDAYILMHLGEAHARLGDFEAALKCHAQALEIGHKLGNVRMVADALNHLGRDHLRQGRHAEALAYHKEALVKIGEAGNGEIECEILIDLGKAHLAVGENDAAIENHRTALGFSSSLNNLYYKGLAHSVLSVTLEASGRKKESSRHRKEALAILTPMGIPEAEVIAAGVAFA
ncbi:BTAD domain-containing putative transcriptional regulator [Streptosporangium sp. CA-135522]|uniref:BTAD domain-containing putative transcriptional regulator n=1 Tax=Streptosporangium sp. CA-135522 TaxID=3240072 RepID=UPI003D8EE44C